ncbi:MAG: hypothetical protein R2713_17225 [Ilumatobacteraceae bacterium]
MGAFDGVVYLRGRHGLTAHLLGHTCATCGSRLTAVASYGEFQPARWQPLVRRSRRRATTASTRRLDERCRAATKCRDVVVAVVALSLPGGWSSHCTCGCSTAGATRSPAG